MSTQNDGSGFFRSLEFTDVNVSRCSTMLVGMTKYVAEPIAEHRSHPCTVKKRVSEGHLLSER